MPSVLKRLALLMREEQWIYFSNAFSTVFCSIPIVNFRKYELQNYKMGKKKWLKYQNGLKFQQYYHTFAAGSLYLAFLMSHFWGCQCFTSAATT